MFSLNIGKYIPEKIPCLDTFHAMILLSNRNDNDMTMISRLKVVKWLFRGQSCPRYPLCNNFPNAARVSALQLNIFFRNCVVTKTNCDVSFEFLRSYLHVKYSF